MRNTKFQPSDAITYRQESAIPVEDFHSVLVRSTLAARRPTDDPDRLMKMIENADIIITARHNDLLVGICRSVSDYSYCTYVSDLAVDTQYQRKGIGEKMLRMTMEKAPAATLILLSAPKAIDYYPKIGMERHPHCYIL